MANFSTTTPPKQSSTLSRRNCITASTTTVIPSKLILPTTSDLRILPSINSTSSSSQSFGSVDLDLLKPTSSYTSLKDILPNSFVNSPTPASAAAAQSSIAIRNHLVKQAAWAYLQPMSASPTSSDYYSPSFFQRLRFNLSLEISNNRFLRSLTRAFDCFLPFIRLRTSK